MGLLKPADDERRTSRRWSLDELPEIIEVKTDSATVTVVDISSGGLCLVSNERLTPGHGIRLHVISEQQTETIRLRVLRCQLKSRGAGNLVYEAAGKFDKPLTLVSDSEVATPSVDQQASAEPKNRHVVTAEPVSATPKEAQQPSSGKEWWW